MCEYFAKYRAEAASKLGSTDEEAVKKELFALPKLGQHVKSSYEIYRKVAEEAKGLYSDVNFKPKEKPESLGDKLQCMSPWKPPQKNVPETHKMEDA
ncbi:hypothetical protein AAVH_34627 [Aphelenchoides avenae]|nr:hypothetical protein AAVH_34627 [Aphelenchus avenae]